MKHQSICLTIHSLATHGGEERMCVLLANELSKRGYNIIIVTLNQFHNEKSWFNVYEGVKTYTLRKNRYERKLFSYKFFDFLPLFRYKRILKKNNISLVVDVDIHQSLVTTKVTKGTDIKVISWDHFNYERFHKRWSHRIMLDCFNSGEVDKLVVLTSSDRKCFIEKEGLKGSFVDYIYNPSPIANDSFISHNEKKVISVGRLENQKGMDLLVEAWALIEDKTDWVLEIVGDGAGKNGLLEQIKKLNLQHVILSPYTDDIKSKYASASIYALPSRTEGFGLVLVEAATMSLPAVAFDCGGPKEIISEGYNGFLVDAGNVKFFAEKLLAIINDDALRERMSHNAFEESKKYKIDNIINQWENLIESL